MASQRAAEGRDSHGGCAGTSHQVFPAEVGDFVELVKGAVDLSLRGIDVLSLRLHRDAEPPTARMQTSSTDMERAAPTPPAPYRIHESSGLPAERMTLALDLVDRGALVRRIPATPLKAAPRVGFY